MKNINIKPYNQKEANTAADAIFINPTFFKVKVTHDLTVLKVKEESYVARS